MINNRDKELIDTLWNVNKRAAIVAALIFGINRYIMECKSHHSPQGLTGGLPELIDTLWNVNMIPSSSDFRGIVELIDTLWNVNNEESNRQNSKKVELIDTLWNVNTISCATALSTSVN